MMQVQLVGVCHARSGDKGRHCTIGLVPWDPAVYPTLVEQVTPEAVAAHFGMWVRGPVLRYELPRIPALSFVLSDALDGGGVRSLRIDAQGKSMGEALLAMRVTVSDELAVRVRRRPVLAPGPARPFADVAPAVGGDALPSAVG